MNTLRLSFRAKGVGIICRLLVYTLLAAFCFCSIGLTGLHAGDSEERISTLIPVSIKPIPSITPDGEGLVFGSDNDKPTQYACLSFDLSSLPQGITIEEVRLQLVQQANQTTNNQSLYVIPIPLNECKNPVDKLEDRKESALGIVFVEGEQGQAKDEFRQVILTLDDQPPGIEQLATLLLLPAVSNSRFVYHSTKAPENTQNNWQSFKKPRLIIKYTVPQPPLQPVFQSDGLPAVRSRRAFLPEKNPSAQNSYISRNVTSKKTWSYRPAFYDNLVYTLTERDSRKYLDALSPLGAMNWSVEIPEAPGGAPKDPGQHIAVSNSGRLCIVGNQRIIVFQLDPNDPRRKPAMLHNSKVEDLKPDVPPTLGPDGSLYFVNLENVYGLNPDLDELWRVPLETPSDKTSRLTIGPGGEFVYLTARNEGLIAINAQTGEYFTKELSTQGELKALHAPVVIRHPDKTEKIYAAANSINSGILTCFNNFKTNREAGLAENDIEQEWKIEGLFSQPIIDSIQPDPDEKDPLKDKKLYCVRIHNGKGELIAINWLKDDQIQEGKSFPVGLDGSYLLAGGNLALDKDDHIFIWNGDGGQSNLYGFKLSPSRIFFFNFFSDAEISRIFNAEISSFPPESQLLFGTDGTLYANDVKGCVLRAVLPQYTLGEETKNTNIYSPTHLRVDGTAGGNKEWVLKAGGSVLLGNGFALKKGASLLCKTGF